MKKITMLLIASAGLFLGACCSTCPNKDAVCQSSCTPQACACVNGCQCNPCKCAPCTCKKACCQKPVCPAKADCAKKAQQTQAK